MERKFDSSPDAGKVTDEDNINNAQSEIHATRTCEH